MTDCPLDICDGSGWIQTVDFTGSELEVCPCSYPEATHGVSFPADVDEGWEDE